MRRFAGAGVLALVWCTACSAAPAPVLAPAPSPAPARHDRLSATLGGVPLRLEVADDAAERGRGLMGRSRVPPGTGMIFRYEAPSTDRYWMKDVPIPLRATFVRQGVVVHTVVMSPCREPDAGDCPSYGAPEPFDAVVETAPDAVPDIAVGDRFDAGDVVRTS